MARAPRWAVIAVDLDGTLIHGTTASLHLSEWIGHRPIIEELERRFVAGEITSAAIADGDAAHYAGLTIAQVANAMASAPLIENIGDGVQVLNDRGVPALLCTVAWSFAARCVADRFGFTAVSGTVMDVDASGRLSGRVARYFEAEDKVSFVEEFCRAKGLAMDQVVAIGDGRSDLPLFEAVEFSVALNGSPEARARASVAVDSRSFMDALSAVPGLLA